VTVEMATVLTGTLKTRTQLQSDQHRRRTNTGFSTGRMPFLPPNQQRQTTAGKLSVRVRSQVTLRSSPLSASSLPLRSLLRMNDRRLLNDELRFFLSPVYIQQQ